MRRTSDISVLRIVGFACHTRSSQRRKHGDVTLDKDAKETFPPGSPLSREKVGAYANIIATGSRAASPVFIQFSCDNANVTGLLPSSVGYVCYAL